MTDAERVHFEQVLDKVLSSALGAMQITLSESQKGTTAALDTRIKKLEDDKQAKAVAEARQEGLAEGTGIGNRVSELEKAQKEDDIWKKDVDTKVKNWTRLGWILLTSTVSLLAAVLTMFIQSKLGTQ